MRGRGRPLYGAAARFSQWCRGADRCCSRLAHLNRVWLSGAFLMLSIFLNWSTFAQAGARMESLKQFMGFVGRYGFICMGIGAPVGLRL